MLLFFFQALHELVKCNYNTREALERYCSRVKSSKGKQREKNLFASDI